MLLAQLPFSLHAYETSHLNLQLALRLAAQPGVEPKYYCLYNIRRRRARAGSPPLTSGEPLITARPRAAEGNCRGNCCNPPLDSSTAFSMPP